MQPNLKEIAEKLGISSSTVSRALRDHPRIAAATKARVKAALKEYGYQLDPIVSTGMSRIRKRTFYRETIAWCGDCPPKDMPWLKSFFKSLDEYGLRLGYKVEHYNLLKASKRELNQLTRTWEARGIRGILLGPFSHNRPPLRFAWDNFAWVSVGHAPDKPTLHSVGRNYELDIKNALIWLRQNEYHRPCFILDPEVAHIFKEPLLSAALMFQRNHPNACPEPYFELSDNGGHDFDDWFNRNRPDCVILPRMLQPHSPVVAFKLKTLKQVYLSPPTRSTRPKGPYFCARYDMIGRVAVAMLHLHLSDSEFGLPDCQQVVKLNSTWTLD
ncbi:LacI family DNA-binding transcriptional regulator [Rubellicoccus peritrichatus]|uniref:LacI family DNA-binding transcriptional regulator n=1 Tax=Rubellicoccus peritrichatus TaxID=3080537 RepID=A0AAQ3QTD6_9BACT|nr:LacI family DNA-binding transcriptional regulator [Puniceicoccus sp. CR14]WOO43598.1 LacI family DNA-binding transcriptional regulator [Puniceicoccus sp. CR14]